MASVYGDLVFVRFYVYYLIRSSQQLCEFRSVVLIFYISKDSGKDSIWSRNSDSGAWAVNRDDITPSTQPYCGLQSLYHASQCTRMCVWCGVHIFSSVVLF